jgi:hypothetical protein
MKIYVGGSLRDVPIDSELSHEFVASLGTAIARQGHILLTGARSSVDREIASAAQKWLTDNAGNPKERIFSFCLECDQPSHSVGTLRRSALSDWGMNHPDLVVPEQIDQADVTIFVAGGEGTFWAKNWAQLARKPILGIPRFAGAGQKIYNKEQTRLKEINAEDAGDYETLNEITNDMADYAAKVVHLAERLVLPRTVFTIMSFKTEYIDVFDSCLEACERFRFEAVRTDESVSSEPILPRILKGIRNSAFVIADVTELSSNVFYEVGYAKGLGKEVILIAKKGTELPFDLKDLPTFFWETQRDLKKGLEERIEGVVSRYSR